MPKPGSRSVKKNGANPPSPLIIGIITAVIAGIFTVIVAIINNYHEIFPNSNDINKTSVSDVAITATFTPTQMVSPSIVDHIVPQTPTPTPWPIRGSITNIDTGGICTISAAPSPETGREDAVAIEYKIPNPGGYCTWVIPLNGYNASRMGALTFWVKGEQGDEKFEVGILTKGSLAGDEIKAQKTASAKWQLVTVPFSDLKILQIDSIENFSLGFTFKLGSGKIHVAGFVFTP